MRILIGGLRNLLLCRSGFATDIAGFDSISGCLLALPSCGSNATHVKEQ
jgi:hypothetical protein